MLDFLGNLERTHLCGDLRAAQAGQQVVLMGWVNRRRDHGNLIFLDLRDRSGIAQIVLDKELTPEGHAKGEQVRPEYVVAAVGKVCLRDPDVINPKMPTGEIEIEATELLVLNDTRLAPFSPSEEAIQNEEVRLKYRYIDLRRPEMQRNFWPVSYTHLCGTASSPLPARSLPATTSARFARRFLKTPHCLHAAWARRPILSPKRCTPGRTARGRSRKRPRP